MDETLAIAAAAPRLRIISAPGTSIYQALNRGIEEARAPAIVLLNADDALLPGALAAWLDALADVPEAGIARGRPAFVELDANGAIAPIEHVNRQTARPLDLELIMRGPCAVNSLCVRRAVFDRIGRFDTFFRLAADRDWMLRAWIAGISIREIETPVYRYLSHAGSHTLDRAQRNYSVMRYEELVIVERYLALPSDKLPTPEVVRALRRWHATDTALLALRQGRSREWRNAASTTARGFHVAPLWPLSVAADLVARLANRY